MGSAQMGTEVQRDNGIKMGKKMLRESEHKVLLPGLYFPAVASLPRPWMNFKLGLFI
jgi:hypothetical protein